MNKIYRVFLDAQIQYKLDFSYVCTHSIYTVYIYIYTSIYYELYFKQNEQSFGRT